MDELSQEVLIITFLSLFIIMITVAIISLVLVYQKRQMKFFKEKEQLVNLHQNELLQTRLEIQEQTFKNISQEVHDNIGQVLSLVKLNINTMDCAKSELIKEKISDSRVLITSLSHKEKNELILGKWHISKKSSAQPYYEIVFKKDGVIFNTTGDSLLTYGYQFVPKNLLKLTDKNHEVYLITIKRLNRKKLVLDNFFHDTTRQVYLREKSEISKKR